jgi:hypothetical protein
MQPQTTKIQNQAAPRIPFRGVAEIAFHSRTITSELLELSRKTAFLRLEDLNLLELGSLLDLTLELVPGDTLFTCRGLIVEKSFRPLESGIGVHFQELTVAQQRYLNLFLSQIEKEMGK